MEDANRLPAERCPLVRVRGGHGEIGFALGAAMKERILAYFASSTDYPACAAFLEGGGRPRLERMRDLTRERFPELLEELQGMAAALEIPKMRLFAYQARSEIGVLRRSPGCSTLALKVPGKTVLAHNEDGSDDNEGFMYLAQVTPPSGVTFLSFVYPGLLAGNGPSFNIRGLALTANHIAPIQVEEGVPRYFIGRAVLEAKNLDEAVAIITQTKRAFPWHHNLFSLSEGRILSLETMPDRHHLQEVEGFAVHTNHLVHPEMIADPSKPRDLPPRSSRVRMETLLRRAAEAGRPKDEKECMALLCLHEGAPYSPCRHPAGEVRGATLGAALFKAPRLGMELYHGYPCLGIRERVTIEQG